MIENHMFLRRCVCVYVCVSFSLQSCFWCTSTNNTKPILHVYRHTHSMAGNTALSVGLNAVPLVSMSSANNTLHKGKVSARGLAFLMALW